MQCPVILETYIDQLVVEETRMIENVTITSIQPKYKVLKKEILDQGFYALSTSPKDKKPLLHDKYNENEMSLEYQLDLICLKIRTAHLRSILEEENKKVMIREFGINE